MYEINPENKEYFDKFRFRERIVSAANLYELIMPNGSTKTVILPMVRHYSPDAKEHLNLWEEVGIKGKELEQGFITNQYRFVTRKKH